MNTMKAQLNKTMKPTQDMKTDYLFIYLFFVFKGIYLL